MSGFDPFGRPSLIVAPEGKRTTITDVPPKLVLLKMRKVLSEEEISLQQG